MSGALDAAKLSNVQSAVGGALDGRYYLHISRENARLLVYDNREGAVERGGRMLLRYDQHRRAALSVGRTGAVGQPDPTREPDWQSTDGVETDIPFELVTGDVGLDGTEQRYLSRLTLRPGR